MTWSRWGRKLIVVVCTAVVCWLLGWSGVQVVGPWWATTALYLAIWTGGAVFVAWGWPSCATSASAGTHERTKEERS